MYVYLRFSITCYTEFVLFAPFTFIERQSVGTRVRGKGVCGKRSVSTVGKYYLAMYICAHTSKKEKKVKGNIYGKKGRGRATYIHFFPRRHNSPSTSFPRASRQNNQYEEKLILFPVYMYTAIVVQGCGSHKHLDCVTWQSTTTPEAFYFSFFIYIPIYTIV